MTTLDHARAKELVHENLRGRLSSHEAGELEAHLASCETCRHFDSVERATDDVLARRPKHAPSRELIAKLKTRAGEPPRASRRRAALLYAGIACSLAAAAGVSLVVRSARDHGDPRFQDEAVNDHLRILYSEHPLDIASGGVHQVRPWFEGKVDFAPMDIFEGDDELPMQGGAVAVFMDRKAAAFVYKRRLHVVSLFVMRKEGLPWPRSAQCDGCTFVGTARGFTTVTWSEGELGYVLVSDVDKNELTAISAKMIR